ncbi:MAG: ATP-binding protein, partial [Chloroflexi bacterium]|nr:ATP-binding protein [Chloroflexota bacterium]
HVDVVIVRDVVERHGVTNVQGLRWLVRQLLANAGGLFSAEKFYRALRSQGIAISKDTVHQLLAHLEDCFLIRTVWIEAGSDRQRMVNPRKSYPVDPALIPVFDRTGRANVGHALETAVMVELERRGASVTYVRTPSGLEVDFLARWPSGESKLIQVCADASNAAIADRELQALEEAGTGHPEAVKLLLTLTRDSGPPAVPASVTVQTAYEWMLAGLGSRNAS